MQKIEKLKEKIKEEPQSWEEEIFRFACSLACRLAEEMFKEMDDELKRLVPYPFMEADGVNISLQREKERKAEI